MLIESILFFSLGSAGGVTKGAGAALHEAAFAQYGFGSYWSGTLTVRVNVLFVRLMKSHV
jgi:hypothetical protein